MSVLNVYKKHHVNTDVEHRWENGIDHHPKSVELAKHLEALDKEDFFCWKFGGDGDNGEELMYHLDAYFELQDKLKED